MHGAVRAAGVVTDAPLVAHAALETGVALEKARVEMTSAILREAVELGDLENVGRIVRSTGYFSEAEVDMAVELVDQRLARGEASGYRFLFLDAGGRTTGYACYGPIPGTPSGFDLYWIAVQPSAQGKGAGRQLLECTEDRIRIAGGERIYVETSSKPQYEPTRAFYARQGYRVVAHLEDFYAPGDGKLIYDKVL